MIPHCPEDGTKVDNRDYEHINRLNEEMKFVHFRLAIALAFILSINLFQQLLYDKDE